MDILTKKIALLATAALSLTGCWTSIWTVAPTTETVVPVKTVYTTQVTTPAPKHTTTTTVTVTTYNSDPSFYLDLNAVAAAFAESRTVREFEQILNSGRYMINNLDLNRDGWIDYLRVIETYRGTYHTLLIQACLAPSVFQDVATLIAERRPQALYVEVVGDRYLYGYNYVVRPVFVKRPPMWDVYGRPVYEAWSSPYYYGSWPSYYTRPKPVYLNHYQAYVTTYLANHHYCHTCDYPSQPFYSGYTQMTQTYSRNDYHAAHPDEAFEQRVTHILSANGSGVTVRNAGQLRTEVSRASAKTSSSSTATKVTTGVSSRNTGTTKPRTSVPGTTVNSRVSKSGTTRTTIRTTDASGRTTTVKREASVSPSRTASATRATGTTSGSRTSGATTTRTSGSSGASRR